MAGIGYSSYNDPRLQPPEDDFKEYFAERVDARVQEYLNNPDKLAEADEWAADILSTEHYKAMGSALADLYTFPSDQLIGSDLLKRLYALAEVQERVRLEQLQLLAEEDVKEDMRQEAECFHAMWGDVMQEDYA
ncbi:hypothetical protein [Xylella fastidiosa]|uniref:hypothetical protein n=1 Tax=Xylella fastidiosa TaxID=2371 RepID=UPI000765EAD5|nr:hypothetical protein [Xylella fastidiosa]ALR02751.1 hypothetical protein OY18_11725 [Xylella fastidiosa]KXB13267.1 hypothetical protein ADT29_08595 [Xylella fastidiosa]KXB22598.1 hypothetical protein ADT28_02320 [Xylella fastidiosa]MDG5822983.1 hypothetical protein [Xylella fastidiosa subsp. pauca]MDG5826255.1 hypothetical protein [Xylella fastidiosa subsp. pauca]